MNPIRSGISVFQREGADLARFSAAPFRNRRSAAEDRYDRDGASGVHAFSHMKSERALLLAPKAGEAPAVADILRNNSIAVAICADVTALHDALQAGAGVAVIGEAVLREANAGLLTEWVAAQPPWSDLPFILLTERDEGFGREPAAQRQVEALGNVSLLERPFHSATLISLIRTALRGRRRQYEARARLEDLRESESRARHTEAALRKANETLEARVLERTAELEAANRQLLSQIEERERVEFTLRQMQRLEAIGQLTSGVAHDFNNLLTVVLGNLRFIERQLGTGADAKTLQRLSHMRTAAERGAKLTGQLLAFSRRQRLEPKTLDMNETISGMRDLMQSSLSGGVQVEINLRPGLWPALADPTQIELAVLNLAINARDAMPTGGIVTIETANATVGIPERPEEPPPGEYVVISVRDTGTGMSREVLGKALEPFFTTKEIGKGSGLGLSQVLGFAKQSGGGLRIDSRLGEGTSVKIYLPRAAQDAVVAGDDELGFTGEHHRKGAIILLVDDDNAVREVTASILRGLGYVVLEVGSAGAALDLMSREPNIDLALFDFAMPGMNGMDLARQAQGRLPNIPILFVTGYVDRTALETVGEDRIIHKPFVDDELAHKVRKALARSSRRLGGNVVPLGR